MHSLDRRQFLVRAAGIGAGVLLGDLKTASAAEVPAGQEPFCFCAIADPHCGEPPSKGLEKYGTGLDKFFAAIDAIKQLPEQGKPDFILLLGDIHVDAFGPRLPEVGIPIHATPGNHESDPMKRKALRALFPDDFNVNGQESDYYSFVHKGVRFISMCDAGMGGEHVGQLCSENIRPSGQCEWLEQELSMPETQKILFAHIPPEPEGKDRNMYLSRNDSRWFNALVTEKKPTTMFFGHLHQATAEYVVGSTRAFNVRSACWNSGKAPIGFMHVRISADGIQTREIDTGKYE
ncbi:MAG: metallophosphoesterase [Candidatus Hydrogenedentes bacterium]|nr:metallophosphoesterase [Candidatus Hydrogenedentota bacterium]